MVTVETVSIKHSWSYSSVMYDMTSDELIDITVEIWITDEPSFSLLLLWNNLVGNIYNVLSNCNLSNNPYELMSYLLFSKLIY